MSSASTQLTSAGGILSLLEEEDVSLQQYALQQLDSVVHNFWPEIATAIPRMSEPLPLTLIPSSTPLPRFVRPTSPIIR